MNTEKVKLVKNNSTIRRKQSLLRLLSARYKNGIVLSEASKIKKSGGIYDYTVR